ncbi:MAG: hypothetical protein P8M68_00015 [Aquiluna sp.]|nr:hypothetical protein [Aquiluna sp.]
MIKEIPPWWRAANENTRHDLGVYKVEQILELLERALTIKRAPAKEITEIRVLAKTYKLGFEQIISATKRQPKHRKELAELLTRINADISALKESKGFDLFDESSWQDIKE